MSSLTVVVIICVAFSVVISAMFATVLSEVERQHYEELKRKIEIDMERREDDGK